MQNLELKYLKKTIDSYEVIDVQTRAEFNIDVTQSRKGVHFTLNVNGTFLSDGLTECMTLLKRLVIMDYNSPITQEGEAEGNKKLKMIKKSNIDRLIAQHRASFIPKGGNEGEAA